MNGFEYLIILVGDIYRFISGSAGVGLVTWFLAFVFAWSGTVKLRQPTLAAMAIQDFGVTDRVYPRLGFLVGLFEVLLSIGLASNVLPRFMLLCTLLLLCFFALLIGRSLWRGDDFNCFCFGEINSKLSRWTFARASLLAGLAAILITAPPANDLSRDIEVIIFQMVIALSSLGAIALLAQLPRLISWGKETYTDERDPILQVKK